MLVFFWGGAPDGSRAAAVWGVVRYRFVEKYHLVWQFACYIMPYDVVSFCLLYLMRAEPRKRAPSFNTMDGSYGARADGLADVGPAAGLGQRLVGERTLRRHGALERRA